MITTIFFDVDFTLIHPGPTFQGEGHRLLEPRRRFEEAVAGASFLLDAAQECIYDPRIFIGYTRQIIELMGGRGPAVEACAREIYDEWAACQHFSLYEDVEPALHQLHGAGLRLGLISNTHRCLASFQSHFRLGGLIAAAVSSSQHGYMKPHRSIFDAALGLLGANPAEALMVGDSLRQDVEGALQAGMRAILVSRSGRVPPDAGVPVIRSLDEVRHHL